VLYAPERGCLTLAAAILEKGKEGKIVRILIFPKFSGMNMSHYFPICDCLIFRAELYVKWLVARKCSRDFVLPLKKPKYITVRYQPQQGLYLAVVPNCR